jgi:hypothetical protein
MNVQNRIMRILHLKGRDQILGSDVKGRLHLFDLELNLIRSSPATTYNAPINTITTDDRYAFTKDRRGAIAKWDLDTLQPLDIYDEWNLADESGLMEGEEPSPSPARGIGLHNGRLYTTNGYNQMVVIDIETFDVQEIREWLLLSDFPDCIYAGIPGLQVVSTLNGMVYIGDLEKHEYPVQLRADHSSVHFVLYDKRHDRIMCTQDYGYEEGKGNGIAYFDRDGSNYHQLSLTYDDVEFFEFDHDYKYAYVAGFDGRLYVLDNTEPELKLVRVCGPFRHQIIGGAYVSDQQIYLLTQGGELFCVDNYGNMKHQADYTMQCVWTMVAHPEDDSLAYCAVDDGVEIVRYTTGNYNSVRLERVAKHAQAFGYVQDLAVLPDGSYMATGRLEYVYRADKSGNLIWYKRIIGIPRGVALSSDLTRAMVVADSGVMWELDPETGEILDEMKLDAEPLWSCLYLPDGRRVMLSLDSKIFFVAPDSHEIVGRMDPDYRLKRLQWHEGKLFATGAYGAREINTDTYEVVQVYNELLTNTKENMVLLDNHVHVISYGYQLGSYTYGDAEMVAFSENYLDFPKAIIGRIGEDGVPLMLIGGRGGYVYGYRVENGVPRKSREIYLR